ncbi:hypothetical protein ACGF07_11310 [Kitasatospora sp. NPDC048194]|uniref:hypothetical protein n=1 Tax=Kitasatospora sp. NPDC048194 TaxID=3364045 RepID=UPI00371767DD
MTATARSSTGRGKTALRERLLPRTIEHALGTDYYRRLWPDTARDVTTSADLDRLPVTGKYEPAGGAAAVRHPDRTGSVLLHSSGTTGKPFLRYRSAEEISALTELRRALHRRATAGRTGPERPVLHFTTISSRFHGNTVGSTVSDRQLSFSLIGPRDLDRALELLARHEDLHPDLHDPVVELSGNPDDLVILGYGLAERGLVERLGVERIVCVGDYLSGLTRAFLQRTFGPGTRIVDRYSMSEICGGATRCDRCGAYHFDAHVLPQVVALDGPHSLTAGLGRLVLTELHPFSQVQPLIRYDTGDLVELVDSPCEPGEVSVVLAGRRAHAPTTRLLGSERVVWRPIALREALEAVPEVARAAVYDRIPLTAMVDAAAPLARAEFLPDDDGGPGRLLLSAVPAFAPHLFPERAEQLRATLREAVENCCPETAELVAAGLEVTVRLTVDRTEVRPLNVRSF